MNLPNKLTASRLVFTVVFVIVMVSQMPYHETVALVLFAVASITDYWDGKIARRDKLITNFGILMDPLADKIMVCSAFIAFVGAPNIQVPAWMAVVIVTRELAITGLRLLAAAKHVVLAAERYGKHKTASQIVAIIALLVDAGYDQWGAVGQMIFGFQVGGYGWMPIFTKLALWWAVLMTLVSGATYLWRNRELYIQDM
jgi:CDP-diacylglycerol---glycerol-3-phosphate 3-phosphatidyltransferase